MNTNWYRFPILLGSAFLPLLPNALLPQPPPPPAQATLVQPWQVVRREPHQNLWESTARLRDPFTGAETLRTRRFVELGTGLNVRSPQGDLVQTAPSFTISGDGAHALDTAHQVRRGANLAREDEEKCRHEAARVEESP